MTRTVYLQHQLHIDLSMPLLHEDQWLNCISADMGIQSACRVKHNPELRTCWSFHLLLVSSPAHALKDSSQDPSDRPLPVPWQRSGPRDTWWPCWLCVKVSKWMKEIHPYGLLVVVGGVPAAGVGFSPGTLPGVHVPPFSPASLVISPADWTLQNKGMFWRVRIPGICHTHSRGLVKSGWGLEGPIHLSLGFLVGASGCCGGWGETVAGLGQ